MKIKEFISIYHIINDGSIIMNDIIDDKIIFILSTLENVEPNEIENLNFKQYRKLLKKHKHILYFKPKLIENNWFYYKKNIWVKKPYEKFNWGDFCDIHYGMNDPIVNLNLLINKIYQPKLKKVRIENFDDLNVNIVYKNIFDLIKYHQKILKQYDGLFDKSKKIDISDVDPNLLSEFNENENFQKKWGFLQTTFDLTQNDITKLNEINNLTIFEVFNYLAYHKELQSISKKK